MKLIYRLGIKKPKVGIALSGGSTHGAAHIGVLKVLEREGVKVDMIAGTSAGALVGCAYAAGIPLDEISEIFKKMSWPQFASPVAHPSALPVRYLAAGKFSTGKDWQRRIQGP